MDLCKARRTHGGLKMPLLLISSGGQRFMGAAPGPLHQLRRRQRLLGSAHQRPECRLPAPTLDTSCQFIPARGEAGSVNFGPRRSPARLGRLREAARLW